MNKLFPFMLNSILIATCYGMEQSSLVKKIVNTPQQVLFDIQQARENLVLKENVRGEVEFNLTHPLTFLDECVGCTLSRLIHPERREKFEERVVNFLKKRNNNLSSSLEYVSFGSGEGYSELVIWTKLLSKLRLNSNLLFKFHFIDLQFEQWEDYKLRFDGNREVMLESLNMNSVKRMQSTPEVHQKVWIEQMVYKSFLEFLNKNFPHVKISLHLYSNVEKYITCMQKREVSVPHIITASDLGTSSSAIDSALACKELPSVEMTSFLLLIGSVFNQLEQEQASEVKRTEVIALRKALCRVEHWVLKNNKTIGCYNTVFLSKGIFQEISEAMVFLSSHNKGA